MICWTFNFSHMILKFFSFFPCIENLGIIFCIFLQIAFSFLFVCRESLYLQLKYISGANTGESLRWTEKILKPPAFLKSVLAM